MINRQQLLADLKPLLKKLETDLRARCDEEASIAASLTAEYEAARAADRVGITFEEWRADLITQVAVAWVLSCVFVRFLEDNALIFPPRISGPLHGAGTAGGDAGLQRARDEREAYFRANPTLTDRDYLLSVFNDLSSLHVASDIFGHHNPVTTYPHWLSGDAAQALIEFFQKIDADATGELIHDFTDPVTDAGTGWDTRFLGDLYQDLSEAARKKYALLQTPIFVEEFILERTLEPAIKEFGLDGRGQGTGNRGQQNTDTRNPKPDTRFKMIDPACGSGHFLLGAFARILKRWRAQQPPGSPAADRELVNRTLASIHGVDLNPYAIAIARFRLLIAAMRECHITRLADAPAFTFNLACGDSLLHGPRTTASDKGASGHQEEFSFGQLAHHYAIEDREALGRILQPGAYHAVVANPPYITVKDKALNQAYRDRYPQVCHMKYSLSVPFMQRLVDLSCTNGFTGQITANSFMKREFGKKLIESYLPTWDLTHVIDTSGAYIPGHGTPTVILFGRSRAPIAPTLRTAMGIAGEPATPEDPARGLVWTAIEDQLDKPGSESLYISVNDSPRDQFNRHPWSIGGGGAAELVEQIESDAPSQLARLIRRTGIGAVTLEDEAYADQENVLIRQRVPLTELSDFVEGDQVRHWMLRGDLKAILPYNMPQATPSLGHAAQKRLWPLRSNLANRLWFGTRHQDRGMRWYEFGAFFPAIFRSQLALVFASTATHNHFSVNQAPCIFPQSAPVIHLDASARDADYLRLCGVLNSSTACFWMRQRCPKKGGGGIGRGLTPQPYEQRYDFDATKLKPIPMPATFPLALATQIQSLTNAYSDSLPEVARRRTVPDAATLARSREQAHRLRGEMIALQEELDWQCYELYGLLSEEDAREVCLDIRSQSSGTTDSRGIPAIALGQRAFEIVLARQMAAGEVETTWFTRHGSTPITQIPSDWPADYQAVVQKRIDLIESDKNIGLIEKPEYKRRWNTEPWDEQQERALRGWLLDRLESYFDLDGRMNDRKEITARGDLTEPRLNSIAKVADLARADRDFMQVAEIYSSGRLDFDVLSLVTQLIEAESVPALPVLRYKPSGMDKRKAWERTWELQRQEDGIDALFEGLIHQARGEGEVKPMLPAARATLPWISEQAWQTVAEELAGAAKALAEARKQKLNLESPDILKPVHECARRARKAAVGDIPVPPKYTSADFISTGGAKYWSLRGKLDVPKERWVSFPHCEGEDGTLIIAWAGYDHLQMAKAVAERYELAKEREGRKLVPLLAAIGQLVPWLKQWHNEMDAQFGTRMGDYFEKYLEEEAKAIEMSVDEVMGWVPAERPRQRRGGRRLNPEVTDQS